MAAKEIDCFISQFDCKAGLQNVEELIKIKSLLVLDEGRSNVSLGLTSIVLRDGDLTLKTSFGSSIEVIFDHCFLSDFDV